MCPFCLVSNVLTQYRCAVHFGLERVDKNRKLFIFHLDRGHTISCGVAIVGNDKSNFLCLEQNLAIGQHHLLVTGKGWHPVQSQRFQIGSGQHGMHARQCQRLFGIDRFHARMCIGRAHKITKQHAGQFNVIDVIALALCETGILDALARCTKATQRSRAFFLWRGRLIHYADSFISFIFAAASRMAFTMF